jgi:hypothetical protein
MRNLKTKVVEKIETHFIFSNIFILENLAIYEIMWENPVKPDNMAHARCILDTKDYTQQQQLHECSSVLSLCTWPVLFNLT